MNNEKLKDIIYYIADKEQFRPGVIEKDYYLTKILNSINDNLSSNIVFKGGTLLNKVYLNYHRLSEDLDFSFDLKEDIQSKSQRSRTMKPIKEKMGDFISSLGLSAENLEGRAFNNSTQYVFYIQYDSFITNRKENIKLEISLRQPVLRKAEIVTIKHFYQDPFTGENLFPYGNILALALEECVAEKLKAAISRLTPAIRDFYDLNHFIENKYSFENDDFLALVNFKLKHDSYDRDYRRNLGLADSSTTELKRSIKTDLDPMIRTDEQFNLEDVLNYFNKLFTE